MDHFYQAAAVESEPKTTTLISEGFPTNGNPALGIAATQPGAGWFHAVASEIINAIKEGEVEPNRDTLTQLALAITNIAKKASKDAVLFIPQALALSEQIQACANIGIDLTAFLPCSAVISLAGETIPDGFLLCNGVAVSRTDYAELFDAIGTKYGSGDGSTTFNLPDARDRHIQGAGTNTLGTYLEAGLPNIIGTLAFRCVNGSDSTGLFLDNEGAFHRITWPTFSAKFATVTAGSTAINGGQRISFNANQYNSIYASPTTTVQPPSLVFNYVIKY